MLLAHFEHCHIECLLRNCKQTLPYYFLANHYHTIILRLRSDSFREFTTFRHVVITSNFNKIVFCLQKLTINAISMNLDQTTFNIRTDHDESF